MISVLDYGVGNLGSVVNMLKKLGLESAIVSSGSEVEGAQRLLIPGVGSFDHGVSAMRSRNLEAAVKRAVLERKVPTLGICLGMQILMDSSEEGQLPGLGLIDGKVKKFIFPEGSELKVPHMGWNQIQVKRPNPLFSMEEELRYYFVHSYYVEPSSPLDVIASCHYGFEFCAAVQKGNLLAVQFHPEKSHKFGLEVFKRFYEVK